MNIIRDIQDYKSDKPTALTIGTFDGVHMGHQVILDKLLKTGKDRNLSTTVVTFDPHPKQVVATDKYSDSIKILSTLDEKIARVVPGESENRWQTIPWHHDLLTAQLQARKLKKPIFLWLMDGNPLGCT